MKRIRLAALALLAAIAATPALAHTGHGHSFGFLAGLSHPFGGLDHMLAMVAVGIWSAATLPARRIWLAPAAFVLAMLAGAGLGVGGIALPMVESLIALSILILGLMIALRLELPVAAGAGLAAMFAIFHGHAHGTEAVGSIAAYMAGFALATSALHLAGVALGAGILQSRLARPVLGLVGGGIAAAGLAVLGG